MNIEDTATYRDTVRRVGAAREKRLKELAEENRRLRAALTKIVELAHYPDEGIARKALEG